MDGGCASFDGYHTWGRNSDARLISPVIDLSGFKDMKLKFQVYHYNGVDSWSGEESPVNESLDVEVSTDGKTFTKITDAPIALYAYSNGWKEHNLDLDAFKGEEAARVAFRCKSNGTFNLHLDNISISGLSAVAGVTPDAVMKAEGVKGAIRFIGMQHKVTVYNVAGQKVAESASSAGSFALAPGVYVLASGDFSKKLIVR